MAEALVTEDPLDGRQCIQQDYIENTINLTRPPALWLLRFMAVSLTSVRSAPPGQDWGGILSSR